MARKKNTKRKHNNNRRSSNVIPELRNTIYTTKSIEKCFGKVDKHSILCATEPALRFYNTAGLLMQDGYNFEKLALVVIDDEYFDWLDEEGCVDNEAARREYIVEMSDANVERLWRKHNLHYNMDTIIFPITYVAEDCGNTNVTLSKEAIDGVKKDIARCYGIKMEDLYVAEQAFRGDYLIEHEDEIKGQIYSTFVDKDFEVQFPSKLFRVQKGISVIQRFIVAAINKDLKPVINVRDLDKIEYHYEDKNLKFSKNTVKSIEKDVNGLSFLSILDEPLSILDVPDFIEDFNNDLQQKAKKAGVQIVR